MPEPNPGLTAESSAVQAHLAMMQDVIRRMSDNSRSCKLWCVTMVAGILVLMGTTDNGVYAAVAVIPWLLFAWLDVYYLSLEQRFRNSYNDTVAKLREGTLNAPELFGIDLRGSAAKHAWKSAKSSSVFPFYLGMGSVVLIVVWLIERW